MAADGSGDFSTISSAMAYAEIYSPVGVTVQIKDGTYQETVALRVPTILQNYAGHRPLLDGSFTLEPTINVGDSITALISGIDILGSYGLGAPVPAYECNIFANERSDLTVTDCNIYNFTHCGIKSKGRVTLTNNKIYNGGYSSLDHCIYIAAYTDVGEHIISGNEIYGASGYGIHQYYWGYNCRMENNNVHDNVTGGIVFTGEGHTIKNNTVINNGARGLFFYGSDLANLDVEQNTVTGHSVADMAGNPTLGGTNVIDYNTYHSAESAQLTGAHDTIV